MSKTSNKARLADEVDLKAVLRLRDLGLVVDMDSISCAMDRAMDRCRSDLASGTTSDRGRDTAAHDLCSLMFAKAILQGRVQILEEDEHA